MFGLRRKPPVDPDEFAWLVAGTAWAIEVLGGDAPMRARTLILPETFITPPSNGHTYATGLFEQVKSLAGMRDWPCELRAGVAARETKVGLGLALKHESKPAPLGTFRPAGNAAVITYNPTQLRQPANLVATFAHELAHYRIRAQPRRPPGGADLEEHATDLLAAQMGFGIFMANGAKRFTQFGDYAEQGW